MNTFVESQINIKPVIAVVGVGYQHIFLITKPVDPVISYQGDHVHIFPLNHHSYPAMLTIYVVLVPHMRKVHVPYARVQVKVH